MGEKIFVGKKVIANQKIVWDNQCRRVLFCYHCETPVLTSSEEVPEDFSCPNCGCPYSRHWRIKSRKNETLMNSKNE